MEIKSLKDLKVALKDIPEEELDLFGVNVDSEGEGVCLMCWDTEKDHVEKWNEIEEKYPQIKDIDKWLRVIVKKVLEYEKSSGDEVEEEMLSSEDKL